MSETAQRVTRSAGVTPSKPVGQLLATLLILFVHVVVAVVVIVLVKAAFDRRLDRTVVDETLANAFTTIQQGNAGEAETHIATIIEQRPQLEVPLAWGLADYLVVMPQLARTLSVNLRENDTWANGSSRENCVRMETSLRTSQWLETGGVLRELYRALPRTYAFFAACEMQDFSIVQSLSDPSEPVDLAELPPTALPRTAWPLGYLAPIRNGKTEVRAPADIPAALRDYYLGSVAFHQGRLEQARQFLSHDWEQSEKRADTAYLLGAIAEASGDKEQAREWYGKALATGAEHLEAARGYVRVGARN